jgi:HD-like signal output (HDOD) protein
MRLAAMENVPLSRVQETLRTDAVFSGEVLRLANSPLISFRAEITSILHAVAILGLERIKSLATTLVLRSFLTSGAVTPAIRGCWRHNLATAIVCDRLARFVHLDRDTCYTAGLLHDIGRLGLLRTGSADYEQILVREGVTDFEVLQFERSARRR